MDPVTLATVTAALTVLGTEVTKSIASEAGKSAWEKVKDLFDWSQEPEPSSLPPAVAKLLAEQPQLATEVLDILNDPQVGTPARLIGRIEAGKVVMAQKIVVGRDFTM